MFKIKRALKIARQVGRRQKGRRQLSGDSAAPNPGLLLCRREVPHTSEYICVPCVNAHFALSEALALEQGRTVRSFARWNTKGWCTQRWPAQGRCLLASGAPSPLRSRVAWLK